MSFQVERKDKKFSRVSSRKKNGGKEGKRLENKEEEVWEKRWGKRAGLNRKKAVKTVLTETNSDGVCNPQRRVEKSGQRADVGGDVAHGGGGLRAGFDQGFHLADGGQHRGVVAAFVFRADVF